MPKVILNPLFQEIRGQIHGMVLKLSPQGELIISKLPDMTKVKWSKAQKAHRRRFKQAVADTKAALADPAQRAKYEKMAKKQGKRPWDVAFSHHMKGSALPSKGSSRGATSGSGSRRPAR